MKLPPNHPGVGVHPGIPNEKYHELDGYGSTNLKDFLRSPAHMITGMEPEEITAQKAKAYRIGRGQHTMILEPHLFDEEFAVLPAEIAKANKNSKVYKEGRKEFEECEAKGREIMFPDEMDDLRRMRDAVWSNADAVKLLTGENRRREHSVWSIKKVNGVEILIKCRPDLWLPGVIIDLKTTEDASKRAYQRTVHNFGYHIQGAHYTDVVAPHSETEIFGHIVVEKSKPFGVKVYRIDPNALELGRTILDNAVFPRLAECIKANEFPSYPGGVDVIDVPAYAYTQAEFDNELNSD